MFIFFYPEFSLFSIIPPDFCSFRSFHTDVAFQEDDETNDERMRDDGGEGKENEISAMQGESEKEKEKENCKRKEKSCMEKSSTAIFEGARKK